MLMNALLAAVLSMLSVRTLLEVIPALVTQGIVAMAHSVMVCMYVCIIVYVYVYTYECMHVCSM